MQGEIFMEDVCCPKFNPKGWDGKKVVWNNKLFTQSHVICLFHIPLNIGPVMQGAWKKIMDAKADSKDAIILTNEKSMWGSEVFMSATKNVPGAKMKKISGTFICKVFEGNYSEVPKWLKQVDKYLASKKMKAKDYYFYYTTCPKCAKKYGKNYVVIYAQVK
jgi:hypothetical protein